MTIVLRSLVVRSGPKTLVDGVDLCLAPGSRTALVGASGAGKSLTCSALAGTLPAGLEVGGALTIEPDDEASRGDEETADPPDGRCISAGHGKRSGDDPVYGRGYGSGDRCADDRCADGGGSRESGGAPRLGRGRSASRSLGVDLLGLPAAQRPRGSRIALVAQDHSTALHPLIPIGAQIALAARVGGARPGQVRRRAEEMLRAVGLDADLGRRVPGRLSGGQRQRAAIALALASRPAVLIADEPTTALDVVARAEILDLLTRLTAGGGVDGAAAGDSAQGADSSVGDASAAPALLLITHDLPAAAVCEDVVVLHGGTVIEQGPAARVLTRPEHPVTAAMCEAAAEETIDGALRAVADRRGANASAGPVA